MAKMFFHLSGMPLMDSQFIDCASLCVKMPLAFVNVFVCPFQPITEELFPLSPPCRKDRYPYNTPTEKYKTFFSSPATLNTTNTMSDLFIIL